MKNIFSISTIVAALFLISSCGGSGGTNSSTAEVITRVSVDSMGTEGNGASTSPSFSSDGRYVSFESTASNLVTSDTNAQKDIFVHDRQTGTTTRVSVSSSGTQGNADSSSPCISGDGRYVSFHSTASNLVTGDTNATYDVFVHDRQTGTTTRVSVSSGAAEGNALSVFSNISYDGRYVSFESTASNLIAGDTNALRDIFVHDRQTGATTRVSVSSGAAEGDDVSFQSDINESGRYISFRSNSTNLVASDTNNDGDIFVHDRQTGATTRVSVSSLGAEGNGTSFTPQISGDGRYVAFASEASNLVSGDANNVSDVFIFDQQTSTTTRVCVSSSGTEANGISSDAGINSDGRYISFQSNASNLVSGDANVLSDVFVHDRQTGTTTRVSVSSLGAEGNAYSNSPQISGDGRYIAFNSEASNFVINDNNNEDDIFTIRVP